MLELTKDNKQNASLIRKATYASVGVAFSLISIKFSAYLLTDSVALLSSLVDSVLDLLASIVNLFAVRHALEPADEEHRFGHGKAEPLAGLAQAAFIAGSSLFLIFEATNHIVNPIQIQHGNVGISVMIISLILTISLVHFQRSVIRKTNSIAVKADSLHYLSDIILNISVIVALVLATYFGWSIADPILALCIAAYIIYSAWKIASISLDQLMDRELPVDEREKIKKIALQHSDVIEVHDLRTRASGKDIFIQFHLEMDGGLSLLRAHQIADEVEAELHSVFPNADVLIHEDPEQY